MAGWRQLRDTFDDLKQLKTVSLFLIAYFLYIDAVQTIARMAVDYGLSLGFPSSSLITALLITQFVGFPAAIAFGKLGEKLGAKTGIYIAIAVYTVTCVFGYFMQTVAHFYALAIVIGLVQGGVQSLSRSFYSRIIPKNKPAEFFGFYNMLGKFSTVIGPWLMGWVGAMTGNPRYSILSVIILFIGGRSLLRQGQRGRGPPCGGRAGRVGLAALGGLGEGRRDTGSRRVPQRARTIKPELIGACARTV